MSEEASTELAEMPFLKNVGLILTYKCQVTCPHCILKAGPYRKEEMLMEDALQWVRQIACYRSGYIRVLSLTGGEPFYNLETLKQVADFGDQCGLFVSAVTNAFWAEDRSRALDILRQLKSIRLISVSTDKYHQEQIPFERVRNAVTAAKECGVPFTIAVCTEDESDPIYTQIMEELREIAPAEAILTAITFPVGRALDGVRHLKYQTTPTPPVSACMAGSSPIIFPDGRVIACIGPVIDIRRRHPLLLGNLREETLEDILDRAEVNPILHAIRVWGPRKLIAILRDCGLGQHLPEQYIKASVCNACYSLMNNPLIADFLNQLATDAEFRRRVAYGRVYYLREAFMAERFERDCPPTQPANLVAQTRRDMHAELKG